MAEFVSVDGRIVRADEPSLPANDPGIQWGWGLFETLRVYHGEPFALDLHLDRMRRSMPRFDLKVAPDPVRVRRQIELLCECNRLTDAAARISITKGGHWMVLVRALDPVPDAVRLVIAPWRRWPTMPLYGHKTLNYLENMLARELAKKRRAFDAVYLDPKDHILEGSSCNVYIVARGWVRTPSLRSGILEGVTRRIVLRLCRRVREGPLTISDLLAADEVFVTNSLIEVRPVSHLNGKKLKGVHSFTDRLAEAYRALTFSALRRRPDARSPRR